jgi:hypothetical protein
VQTWVLFRKFPCRCAHGKIVHTAFGRVARVVCGRSGAVKREILHEVSRLKSGATCLSARGFRVLSGSHEGQSYLRFSESFRIPQIGSIIFKFDTMTTVNTRLTQHPASTGNSCLIKHQTVGLFKSSLLVIRSVV